MIEPIVTEQELTLPEPVRLKDLAWSRVELYELTGLKYQRVGMKCKPGKPEALDTSNFDTITV